MSYHRDDFQATSCNFSGLVPLEATSSAVPSQKSLYYDKLCNKWGSC